MDNNSEAFAGFCSIPQCQTVHTPHLTEQSAGGHSGCPHRTGQRREPSQDAALAKATAPVQSKPSFVPPSQETLGHVIYNCKGSTLAGLLRWLERRPVH